MKNTLTVQFLEANDGAQLAYDIVKQDIPAESPGIIWLGGFKSDMTGTKASALAQWAQETNHSFLRFDYFAHGASQGSFREGTIGRWKDDALLMMERLTKGPQILIGSSMGAWIALLVALARPEQVKGIVLIAPAPDFTEDLMWAGFDEDIKKTLLEDGLYSQPSEYDEPYEITLKLIEDGRNHLLLNKPIPLHCPVRILQGVQDEDVPWEHAVRTLNALASDDVTLQLNKVGDHRLSEPDDIARLMHTVEDLLTLVQKTELEGAS